MSDIRDVAYARDIAIESLETYAELLLAWNAPDDEHTRLQLRGLIEDITDKPLAARSPSRTEREEG